MRLVVHFGLVLAVGFLLAGAPAWASAHSEMEAARAEGKAVFVVVTQTGDQYFNRAFSIAKQAQSMAPNTAVVVLDRGARENQGLVKHFRLRSVPVPLVLVVASNGVGAGGALLKDLTPQKLVGLIPSPKKAEVLLHRTQGKPVIVIASRGTMPQRGAVFAACDAAIQRHAQGKVAVFRVLVDMDDPAEKAYLTELRVNPKEAVPTTVIFNNKGKKTAVFRRMVTAEELFKAAVQKAPCCPDGKC